MEEERKLVREFISHNKDRAKEIMSYVFDGRLNRDEAAWLMYIDNGRIVLADLSVFTRLSAKRLETLLKKYTDKFLKMASEEEAL